MKRSIVAALIAALSITGAIGVSAASGDGGQKASASASKKGKRGPRGKRGFTGPQGPAGIASITRVNGPAVYQGSFGSGSEVQTSTATCPAGMYVTGGGYNSSVIENFVEYSISSATQHSVIAVNYFNQGGTITAQAVCVGGGGLTAASVRSRKTPQAVLAKAQQLQSALDADRK